MESLSVIEAKRLALARAGLLLPGLTELGRRASGRGRRARQLSQQIIERFGYLQLDSVSVAGARSQGIVLASRLEGLDASLAETLLAPGEPLFEYWGHEASWIPLYMYPWFRFRRRQYRVHPWWGDVLSEHPRLAKAIVTRIRQQGPVRSADLEGASGHGWWNLKLTKRVAEALWLAGDLAISSRQNFLRRFDLAERVIPDPVRTVELDDETCFDLLLLKALDGHGWATTGTLAATWRLANCREAMHASLDRLVESGEVVHCRLRLDSKELAGWVRTRDLSLLPRLKACRPRASRGVLLSPFDPLLWDRKRTAQLFGFDQVLEIYKPSHRRRHGYYCLPVLAGDKLIARVDLKADRSSGQLRTLVCHYEQTQCSGHPSPRDLQAVHSGLQRFADSVGLALEGFD